MNYSTVFHRREQQKLVFFFFLLRSRLKAATAPQITGSDSTFGLLCGAFANCCSGIVSTINFISANCSRLGTALEYNVRPDRRASLNLVRTTELLFSFLSHKRFRNCQKKGYGSFFDSVSWLQVLWTNCFLVDVIIPHSFSWKYLSRRS